MVPVRKSEHFFLLRSALRAMHYRSFMLGSVQSAELVSASPCRSAFFRHKQTLRCIIINFSLTRSSITVGTLNEAPAIKGIFSNKTPIRWTTIHYCALQFQNYGRLFRVTRNDIASSGTLTMFPGLDTHDSHDGISRTSLILQYQRVFTTIFFGTQPSERSSKFALHKIFKLKVYAYTSVPWRFSAVSVSSWHRQVLTAPFQNKERIFCTIHNDGTEPSHSGAFSL